MRSRSTKTFSDQQKINSTKEDTILAELDQLGVSYLFRGSTSQPVVLHPPDEFLALLIKQSSSRVRNTLIALLLIHPDYSKFVPAAMQSLQGEARWLLKLLYSAAVFLQQKYTIELKKYIQDDWQFLPDYYSVEFITSLRDSPEENLRLLGNAHQLHSGKTVNWSGTFNDVVHHLLHQMELEIEWNQ